MYKMSFDFSPIQYNHIAFLFPNLLIRDDALLIKYEKILFVLLHFRPNFEEELFRLKKA